MNTKGIAAKIATKSGTEMIIANSEDVHILHRIMDGRENGTLFLNNKENEFNLPNYLKELNEEN